MSVKDYSRNNTLALYFLIQKAHKVIHIQLIKSYVHTKILKVSKGKIFYDVFIIDFPIHKSYPLCLLSWYVFFLFFLRYLFNILSYLFFNVSSFL